MMDLGDERTAAGDHEAALKAYQAADGIMGVPTTGLEVGKALEKLGRLIEARDALIRVVRSPEQPDEPAAFKAAREKAARLAAELPPRTPSLTLKIIGLAEGVQPEVSLDGNRLQPDLFGLPVKVNPGERRVKATAAGYLPVEQSATLAEGEKKELELAFQPDPNASAASTSTADGAPVTGEAELSSGRRSRTLMWIGFGVGAAGVLAGSVTGVMSLSKAGSAKDACDGNRCPPEAQDDIDSSKTLANVSNVAFAVGVVGIGVGVWQLFATRSAARETPPAAAAKQFRAEPVIGIGHVGVVGHFAGPWAPERSS